MELIKTHDSRKVFSICETVIKDCYSRYYPFGAVEYFLNHHSIEAIEDTMEKGEVYLCAAEGEVIGTVSLTDNEIHRLYILPKYQGRGYGAVIMDICEDMLFKDFESIRLDSALSSFNMYIKRGYTAEEMVPFPLENGNVLCYFPMVKSK